MTISVPRPAGSGDDVPVPIILDCDPGHDDAIAMLLAHGSPAIELLAVTTVAGNESLQKVTRNAQAVASIGGFAQVPVAAGCARPLVRPAQFATGIHGESGMDGPVLPEPVATVDSRHAVSLIVETIMTREPGTVTLVATGAHTNLALAARLEPRIVPRVREVVFMGGAISGGNWSAAAEFNIAIDPEAAHIVVHEPWPVTMIGLDVTHRALATREIRDAIAAVGTGPARFVGELLDFFAETYSREQGFAAPPVHDPVAVAAVIDRAIISPRRAPLEIELGGQATAGMTVADLRKPASGDCRTQVGLDLDVGRFWQFVVDALQRIGDPLPGSTGCEP